MIPAVVLAAGRSTRMGRPKAMLPLGPEEMAHLPETFLTRIVRTLLEAGVDDIVIVLGYEAGAIAASFSASGLPARLVVNDAYDRGQLSSLQTALAVVDRPGISALLVTLVDVPLVTARTVRAVLDCYRQTHAPVVRPTHGERHGHPLLIDRSLFAALRAADPATGAKSVIRAHATALGDLAVDDEGAFIDIDTPDDYQSLIGRRSWEAPRKD